MDRQRPPFQTVDGIRIPPFFSTECFESALRFRPDPGEIFIATYPKCGTTWMQNLVLNVLRKGQPLDRPRDFFLASPFLDQLGAEESKERMIRPGAYKTHLPFYKVPWSDECKYIYVARNPMDCSVSFYHHMRQIPGYQFSTASFDDFLELFLDGDLECNDYFDHLLSWYRERERPNILFTTYESMKHDLREEVLRVARFLGSEELAGDLTIIDKIVQNCNFENMQFINEAINSMYDDVNKVLSDPTLPKGRKHIATYVAQLPRLQTNHRIEFLRTGKVGSWTTTYTKQQSERMNSRIQKKTKDSDVMMLWDNILKH